MNPTVMVVDDDPDLRATFEIQLTLAGYRVVAVESAEKALARLHATVPDVILTDIQMDGMSGLELLQKVKAVGVDVDVVVITGYEDMRSAISAIQDGAYDYMAKPVDMGQLHMVLQRCFRDRTTRRLMARPVDPGMSGAREQVIGRSPKMIEIYKLIGMLATTRAPVLIRGETGTGKELIARAIHEYSPWSQEPFVALNCTAIAETLLESELFGHIRGAFTGAVSDRRGKFEMAGTGTIFLDEIGDTSTAFQAKLLRVLQEREFCPVGAERPQRTEARVIAATHRPIEQLIREERFREDLYFRLRVVEICVPPLRERPEDIPILAEHLLAKASRAVHKEVRIIPPDVVEALCEYSWPGNVREMENTITRAVVLAHGNAIRREDVSVGVTERKEEGSSAADLENGTLQEVERAHVERVLRRTGGHKRKSARILGISRPRLDRLLAKYEQEDAAREHAVR